MRLVLMSGSAHRPLGEAVASALGSGLGGCLSECFPDGERHIEVTEDVRGCDVYLLQPLGPPAGEYLLELLLLADACRRGGAARVTGLVPYLAYARHDRRKKGREPLGARLIADLIQAARLERLITVDLHSPAVEGCFGLPVEHLSAAPLLAEHLRRTAAPESIIVSPDLGAVKRAEAFAEALKLPVAVVQKSRLSGSEVEAHALTGEVRGRAPILVDDMISTAGTVEAAAQVLLEAGCARDITVVATHALLVGPALERLRKLPLRRLLTTDSLPRPGQLPLPIEVVSLAPLLARTIERLRGAVS